MIRTEDDLRGALRQLERRADQHGAPSTAAILSAATGDRPRRGSASRHVARWLPPLAVAAVVAAVAITAAVVSTRHDGSSNRRAHRVAGRPVASHPAEKATPTASHHTSTEPNRTAPAAAILEEAATKLDAASGWTTPAPQDFYYVRTTEATTWTSVSGTRPGEGRTAQYGAIPVPACVHGRLVANGESGHCTLDDVPHYVADAPTTPAPWDTYLEHMAPGARAADAQGKIIVEVLHQDLVAPKAAAALLRYTATCPGLHTLTVRPVAGEKLVGVTCTSMTNGSYGLTFDAASHAFVGFVEVTAGGRQAGPAEIIRQTGIVPAIGRTP